MPTQSVSYANGVITITKRDGSQQTMSFSGTSSGGGSAAGSSEQMSATITTGASSVFSSWIDIKAALLKDLVSLAVAGTVRETTGNLTTFEMQIAKGAAGSEQIIGEIQCQPPANATVPFALLIDQSVPAGTRLSYRTRVGVSPGAAASFGVTMNEAA